MKHIALGAGLGFYGDSIEHVKRSVQGNRIDYLCSDHLGELTLSILQHDRRANPELGYTKDLVPLITELWPLTRDAGTRFICNGGGLNPRGAAVALQRAMAALGFSARIAVVEGDDVLSRLHEFHGSGEMLINTDTGKSFAASQPKFGFANAYLGARPLVEALRTDADIVVTGRVADASLYLAPLVHEFGWDWDDYDRLACGLTVGHLLECTAQVSGGNFAGNWTSIPDLGRVGYPIATVDASGAAVISKAPGSGGRVSVDSVRQQLLYEVHDPRAYLSPDVSLDMTTIEVQELMPNHVRVSGATGKAPPTTLKVVGGFAAGYAVSGMLGYSWPDALGKARAAAAIMRESLAREEFGIDAIDISFPGFNSLHRALSDEAGTDHLNECFVRIAIQTADRSVANRFARHFSWMMVGGPPDVVYIPPAPPRALTAIWPTQVARERIEDQVTVEVIDA